MVAFKMTMTFLVMSSSLDHDSALHEQNLEVLLSVVKKDNIEEGGCLSYFFAAMRH